MRLFKKHQKRGSYDLFSNYDHYTPGVGGMFGLLGLFLAGGLLGNLALLAMQAFLPEVASDYGMIVSYPLMFIPAMLYASAKSRFDENFTPAVPVDSNNFGRLGGFAMAVIVSVATLAAAFITDITAKLLPPMPAFLEEAMKQLLDAPLWITLISVAVFAPFFEEWLCRGMIMRGLLGKMSPFAAISISAAFFAVIHLNPWQAIPAFILGLLFGLVYYKTGSLKLTMLMHCVNNILAAIFSRIPAFQDAESFIDVMNPWTYAGICLCSLAFIAATIVVLMSIKTND
jgi:membrane protease YdiL (CAAX protease family)